MDEASSVCLAVSIKGASLDAAAPPVYGDAATFFRNTHPSQNLKAVARTISAALAIGHAPASAFASTPQSLSASPLSL